MRVHVRHSGIDDLQRDVRGLAGKSVRESRALIRRAGMVGNTVARDFARQKSGTHGKHYPRSFTHESGGYAGGLGGGNASFYAEYGPDANRRQGGMNFEFGPGPQTAPHLNLARSADLMGPVLAQEVRQMAGGWFW